MTIQTPFSVLDMLSMDPMDDEQDELEDDEMEETDEEMQEREFVGVAEEELNTLDELILEAGLVTLLII